MCCGSGRKLPDDLTASTFIDPGAQRGDLSRSQGFAGSRHDRAALARDFQEGVESPRCRQARLRDRSHRPQWPMRDWQAKDPRRALRCYGTVRIAPPRELSGKEASDAVLEHSYIIEAMPGSLHFRGLLAWLCIGVLLFAAVAPASASQLVAVLVPVTLFAVAIEFAGLYRGGTCAEPHLRGFLSLSLSRAPPSV